MTDTDTLPGLEVATLAGGCFWCLDAVFRALRGVHAVTSGYMGGELHHPGYEAVCSGRTGHAEVVQLRFDPAEVSFRDILEVFFAIHDPTSLNRQGNDVGTQYRSAIFWHTPAQADAAREVVARLSREQAFPAPIVTELSPATTFWPAEDYHQDYYSHRPNQPYCMFVVGPKVAKFRSKFAAMLKDSA